MLLPPWSCLVSVRLLRVLIRINSSTRLLSYQFFIMVLGGVQAKAQKAGHSFAHAFSSKEALINALRTDEDDNPLLVGNQRWSNKDLEPTGPGMQCTIFHGNSHDKPTDQL